MVCRRGMWSGVFCAACGVESPDIWRDVVCDTLLIARCLEIRLISAWLVLIQFSWKETGSAVTSSMQVLSVEGSLVYYAEFLVFY